MSKNNPSVAQIIAILAVAGTILGMDISSISIFLTSDFFKSYFNNPGPAAQGIMTGANPVGGLVGCVLFGVLTERTGRVSTFRILSLIWILGSIFSALVLNVWMITVGRLVRGMAVGSFSVLLPVYIGEVIPAHKKGTATAVVQLSITSAILVTFFVCFLLSFLGDQASFRIAWGLEMIPALLVLLLSFSLIESPKWLVSHGEYDKAREILQHFKPPGMPGEKVTNNVRVSKIDILELYGTAQKTRYSDLFSRSLWKHTIAGITIQVLVQTCGINTLMFYIVYICEMIGLRGKNKLVAALIPCLINVVFTFVPILTLDHLRRKVVIVSGGFTLAAIMILIGGTMGVFGHAVATVNGNSTVTWKVEGASGFLVMALCFLFVAIFASTLSCCAWLYTSEIFPLRAKPKGMAFCMAISWFLNATLTFTTPLLLSKIRWVLFVLLGCITCALTVLIGVCFPETLGLTEQQVCNLFKDKNFDNENTKEKDDVETIKENTSRSSAPSPYIFVDVLKDSPGVDFEEERPF